MMPHKAKNHYNQDNKYTFSTQDMEKAVAEYNKYMDSFNRIDAYLKGDALKTSSKKELPFHKVIDIVATAIADSKQDKKDGFTTYYAGQISKGFAEYENYFNEIGNDLEKMRREYNVNIWKAAVKLSEEFEKIAAKINILPLKHDVLKKGFELGEIAKTTKKGLSTAYNKIPTISEIDWNWLSSHSDVSFDAIKIADAIESIAQLKQIHENEVNRIKEEKKKEEHEKSLNKKFAEEYKFHKQEVSELQAKNKDLQAEINKLKKLVDSPHKLAAKDLSEKLKAGIGKIKSRNKGFTSGKER